MPISSPPLVLGFIGENANATLKASTESLNQLLARHGIEAHSIDACAPNWSERLQSFMSSGRPISFGYGYAGVGSTLRNSGQSFWTTYKTPFLSLMYDHPFWNLPYHTVDSPYVANCYFVPDFAEVQKNHVKNPHACFVFRERIGGKFGEDSCNKRTGDEWRMDWRRRTIPYLFVKSGRDPAQQNAAIAALNPPERKVFYECLESLKGSSDLSIADLVELHSRYTQFGRSFSEGVLVRLVCLLDRYIRDWRSRQLVEWLKHKPAIIIGDGWDSVDKTDAVARFLPPRPFEEIEPMYEDSRFVFNTNPYFRDGYHERVTMALTTGAIAVSDRNRFSDEYFSGLDNFVGFDWGDSEWKEKLDTQLNSIEESGGDFDPAAVQKHLSTVFPVESYVRNILDAAAEVRRRAGESC